MEGKCKSIAALAFICLISAVGCYYYSLGFFLTRYEIKEKSAKHHLQPAPQFKRAVLLLVDALRYDFAYKSNVTTNYANQLTVFEDTLESQRNNSWLFEFVADPPTVTMQRIKGITTGSLPTFIDFRDNFHSNNVDEDNLLTQIQLQNKTSIFMGDDTWIGLYPKAFHREFPFDSFNVKDLHTVDQGVIKHLLEELNNDDWTLIIGHMLGVDHVGHTYYANHPTMVQKLKQVDEFIRKIIKNIDEDTLLLVFGDHGMTDDGNHGGTSRKETNSALFAYSKKPFYYRSHDLPIGPRNTLNQIDIVPTLSILLGIGIPFNNLGAIIPELFLNGKSIVDALYINSWQINNYLSIYDTKIKKLPEPYYENLLHDFEILDFNFKSQKQVNVSDFLTFINNAAGMCRMIWTEFDIWYMATGGFIISLSFICIILLVTQDVDMHRIEIIITISSLSCFIHPIIMAALFLGYLATHIKIWKRPSKEFWLIFLFQCLHGYCLFSNSYIVKEDQVLRFLLQIFLLYFSNEKSSNKQWLAICAVCIRFSAALDIVSQKESMKFTIFDHIIMNPLFMVYIPIFLFFYLFWSLLKEKKISMILTEANLFAVLYYWFLQDFNLISPDPSILIKSYLPRLSYILCGISIITTDPLKLICGLTPSLILILGYSSPIVMLTFYIQIYAFYKSNPNNNPALVSLFLSFTASQYFYATGHRCNFPSLQIASAFTGFEIFNIYVSGALLTLNTLGSFLCIFSVFLLRKVNSFQTIAYIAAYFLVTMLLTTLNTAINRRHLMVWPIFAPKYLFDIVTTGFVYVICLIGLIAYWKPVEITKKE
ncbi:PIGO [Blepharisma stoltei]|uniref:GPI ethanolamine phosphate transferase 3 n=1 Tax=Blepharisma stoltei TaxID=1481888 RepID=A0AAU9IXV6_9CILI|nr:unnamed protein product [Blepharisma stoltei]